jgi:hypothetical protein
MTPCSFVGASSISEEHAVRGPKTTYLLMLLIGFEADTGWLVGWLKFLYILQTFQLTSLA